MYDGQTPMEIPSFPTHLFTNIPVITISNIYQFILINCLDVLTKQRVETEDGEGESKTKRVSYIPKMDINKYYVWRLILYLAEADQAKFG